MSLLTISQQISNLVKDKSLKYFNKADLLVLGSLIQEKKALTNIAIPLARDSLPGLLSNLASSAINKFERKIKGKAAVRAGKTFYFFQMKK